MLVVLLLQLTRTAAFSRQRPYSNYNIKQSALQAASAIADVSDGWLSPQQIKTLRKEIDDRRRRKRLAYKRLHDGELAGDFDQATVDAADAALASSEFFEAGGPEKLNVKAWPAVAFALAESCDAMVVQLKKKKCVLYRPLPPGTPGAVVLIAVTHRLGRTDAFLEKLRRRGWTASARPRRRDAPQNTDVYEVKF